jgi:hypothetical protein
MSRLFSIALFCAGPGLMTPLMGAELWCAPDSEYKDVVAGSVGNLRWSLFALSELPNVIKIDTDLLTGLTNA